MHQDERDFHQRWYKHLCEERLRLMQAEGFYAKQRRHVEKAIILYQVDGRWDGTYFTTEEEVFFKTHSLPIGPG